MTILESEHGRKAVEAARVCMDEDADKPFTHAMAEEVLEAALPHFAEAFAEAVEAEAGRYYRETEECGLKHAAALLRTLR